MTVKNIFEYASRNRLRFPYKGMISTEDLWSLPLKELDKIFKTLNSEKKESQEDSLLETVTKENEELNTKIDIVTHIVTTKLKEKEIREKVAENKAKKQKIMQILANRDEQALENASDEDLRKMLAELE